MAEKIKRTHAERDALLSKVFDAQLQTKDVEVTQSGTIKITADDDYLALKEVNLNVNVQGGGGSSWRYFDISKCSIEGIETMAHIVKTYRDGGHTGIISSGSLGVAGSSTKRIAMGIDMAVGFCSIVGSTEIINYGEHLAPIISDILANGAVEITKEEFYAV